MQPALVKQPNDDRTQIASIIAQNYGELLKRARQLVGREEADDLVQSTVEKALRHLDAFAPGTNMLAWLRRIMSNLMIDEWRRQKRRNLTPLLDAERATDNISPEPPPAPAWEGLSEEDVRQAVPGLSRQVRPVFVLHLQGLSYQEIARRLDLRASTVGTRLLRARHQMRRLLTAVLIARQNAPANDVARPTGLAAKVPLPAPTLLGAMKLGLPVAQSPSATGAGRSAGRARRAARDGRPYANDYFCMQSIQ